MPVDFGDEGIFANFTGVETLICFGQPSQSATITVYNPDFIILTVI